MTIRRTLLFLVTLTLLASLTMQFWVSAFIFRPTTLNQPNPKQWGLSTSHLISIPSTDGVRLAGWWKAPRNSRTPVILVVHGRSANISTRAPIMRHLVAGEFGVLMFDYRSYGASDAGHIDELTLRADTASAYRWLRMQGISSDKLIVLGQSLGNAPAADLAATKPVAALVLVSPFTSLPEAAIDRFPWLLPLRVPWNSNRFDVSENVASLKIPVLLIASNNDGLVPTSNGRKVAAAAQNARWLDASPLTHDGMLLGISSDGRLTSGLQSIGVTTERL